MALIGKIRNNPLVVLLFIGGGIALFVLSDIMNSGSSGPIGPVEAMMARVGEIEIERNDFERTLAVTNTSADAYESRSNLWNYYLTEGLIRNETERLGLEVTQPELEELTYGPRYSPVIQQNYGDPQTGQVNAQLLNSVRSRIQENSITEGIEAGELPPNFVDIWRYQNRRVSSQRLQEKLTALVSKAMYAPEWMAQEYADAMTASRRVAIVRVPFDELDNDAVTVSDTDLQQYIDDRRSTFDNLEETRQLTYLSFSVDATPEDSAAVRSTLEGLATEWRNTPARGDSLFALTANGSFTGAYVTEDQLPASVAGTIMNDLEIGEVYGPFVEGSLMALVKLIDRREYPENVAIRRIKRNATIPAQFSEANRLIDSLLTVVREDDATFSELAEEFNRDSRTIATAGVLENVTPGQIEPAAERVAFVTGEPGTWYKIRTQDGVQLLQITSRSDATETRAKVAYVSEPMVPSKDTEDAIRQRAEEFLTGKGSLEEVKAAAEAEGLTVETTRPLDIGTFQLPGIGGGQDVRDLICWAFGADEGDVSGFVYTFTDPNFFYENRYLIAGVENIIPEGVAPVEAVRESILPDVRNQLKGRQLAEAMSGLDLAAAASQYDVVVDTLNGVTFTQQSLAQGIGAEPKVIAVASTLSTGTVSEPIVGERGVYLVKPLSDAPSGSSGSVPAARQAMNATNRSRVAQQLITGLRTEIEIEDQRISTECSTLR
ncbi:peptidyl-prolyl cis-trans isomerase D [Neolewinella xylanilytica]|uniref:Periplasmic chaperone PpiD n=1 Tax=Neolewinella xylanilytica TaxID=1514080 RepID=A0A2S6IAK2_9BACT|nr:SurA N-terminal domain-containing protein [Neolewinella xylanilytica]PPK88530.1 peptidyl-prolyl cis-trans isomerase D [Neolewinella xylanilytica]